MSLRFPVRCVALIFVALSLFACAKPNRTDETASGANSASPPGVEARRVYESKLKEADDLASRGETDAAIARVREAILLDASNAAGHRKLAELYLQSGATESAIDEYRLILRHDSSDAAAWRALAAAQLLAGRSTEAAESYRKFFQTAGERRTDDAARLAYADALRLSGQTDEARAMYQKLVNSANPDVAHSAQQKLKSSG